MKVTLINPPIPKTISRTQFARELGVMSAKAGGR